MADEIWVRVDDPALEKELRELDSAKLRELGGGDSPVMMKLVDSGDVFKAAGSLAGATVVSTAPATPAPAAGADAPAADGSAAGGQCCGAYPKEALTAALGTPVDSAVLWKGVDSQKQPALAESLTKQAAKARLGLLEKSAWATAPEMVLLDLCNEADRPYLAKKILRTRTAITFTDDERRAAQSALERQKVVSAERANSILEEGLEQMREWRRLASLGKWMLIGASVFSAVAIIGVLVLAGFGKLGDVATPTAIFALALFAISPAVLLLRERPLEGLDKWTPTGSSGEDESGGSEGSGDSGSDSGSTTASSGSTKTG